MSRLRKDLAALDRAARAVERNPSALERRYMEEVEARPPDSPPEQATIGAARRQREAACEHLKDAVRLREKDADAALLARREAAEKAWLALVTAGRAILKAAGDEAWTRTARVANHVAELERERFKRTRVGSAMKRYQRALHGRSFYAGESEFSDIGYLHLVLEDIEDVIVAAEAICNALRKGRR